MYLTVIVLGSMTVMLSIAASRPTGSTADDTLLYLQKETTRLSRTRTITNEIVHLDGNGKPATVITKIFSGEGTSGSLFSQENLIYSERGTKAWDFENSPFFLVDRVSSRGLTC